MSIKVTGLKEARQQLQRLASSLPGIGANALVRGVREARAEAARGFASRGIGRGLARRKGESASNWYPDQPVSVSGDKATTELRGVGLAALAEEGGRTDAHAISSTKPHGLLARPGFVASTRRHALRHPGGTVQAQRQLFRTKGALERNVAAQIEAELAKVTR